MTGAEEGSRALAPTTAEEARQIVQEAAERREAIYPVGGGLALDELLPKTRPGIDLSLTGLDRIVEFSPRDLTITVEAGVTLAKLAETVDEAGLLFPFASKFDERSTIGGLLATAWNGPRRTGWGNLRDYVIGMRAIDGRGVAFKSGGKVVKNVAGYDFCKLFVGSRGTLGIITEVTLRLKPRPEANWLATLSPVQEQSLCEICAELMSVPVSCSVFEISYIGFPCNDFSKEGLGVSLGWEGTVEEIDLAQRFVQSASQGGRYAVLETAQDGSYELCCVAHEPQGSTESGAVVIQIQAPPTVTLRILAESATRFWARAGASIVFGPRTGTASLSFATLEGRDLASGLLAWLRDEIGDEGYVTVLRDRAGIAPTRELRFGRTTSPQFLMDRVKAAMDPQGILNPGRYVFADAAGEPVGM